jgi:hypothetical protein
MRALTRILFAMSILLLASPAFAVTLNSGDVVPQNINELPLFGNVQKTPEMLQADETFKAKATKAAGSAEEAAAYVAGKAWEAFQNMKLNEAMKRANQAWLLDNKNFNAYWVMAITQIFRGAPKEEVDDLFEQALAAVDSDNKARLTQDYQTFLNGGENHPVENLAQIAEQYQEARKALLER